MYKRKVMGTTTKRNRNIILLIVCDLFSVILSMLFSYLVLNGGIDFSLGTCIWLIVNIAVTYLMYALFNLYSFVFKNAGIMDALKITLAIVFIFMFNSMYATIFHTIGYAIALLNSIFLFFFAMVTRFSVRLYYAVNYYVKPENLDKSRAMIVGAGDAGATLIREMQISNKMNVFPVCFVDDDLLKRGKSICGVKVVGGINDIVKMVSAYKVGNIFLAMPSVSKKRISEILMICQQTKCKVQIIPGVYQLVNAEVLVSALRDVEPQDLLGREQVKVNLDEIMGYIENNVVLVTGGGGSIGSELCRQIAAHNPRQLVIVDIYENNAYDIEQELKRRLPNLNFIALIASVRDKNKMEDIFQKYRPQIVFNAAAHKHVPLMETSPNEAIKNNVFGTLNVAKCADKYGAKRFVQISTDKAVNPTNIMGASKRICEMIIQTIGKASNTEFVAVRFGNVLGSNGSVIPLFKNQIAEGGPVTVTHKDIIRYFMTIPEAVSLVLQAGAYAKGGEIFVLDMGEPVKIYDLAYNLIKLSGYQPNVDIKIVCTGLRPGEKLYEERLMDAEGLQKTDNGLISVAKAIEIDETVFWSVLNELKVAAENESQNMRQLVSKLVPTYTINA